MKQELVDRTNLLLTEIELNMDKIAEAAEGQELAMYLLGWTISWKNYSPVSSEELNERVFAGLADRLQGFLEWFRKDEPEWKVPDKADPSVSPESVTESLQKAMPDEETSPEQTPTS